MPYKNPQNYLKQQLPVSYFTPPLELLDEFINGLRRKIFYLTMRQILFVSTLLLVLACALAKSKLEDIDTVLVHYSITNNEVFENEIIMIKMRFKVSDPSLEDAIEQAEQLIAQIKETALEYCEDNKSVEEDCGGICEIDKYSIIPQYRKMRGYQTFSTFVVTFKVKIHVFATENIGDLVDTLVVGKKGVIEEMSWEDLQEESEENIIEEGVEKGEQTCQNLGMKLIKINSIEIQVSQKVNKPEKEPEGEEGEEQEQEEQPETETAIELKAPGVEQRYRFQIVCGSDQ